MINPYDLIHILPNAIPQQDIDFLLKLKNQEQGNQKKKYKPYNSTKLYHESNRSGSCNKR